MNDLRSTIESRVFVDNFSQHREQLFQEVLEVLRADRSYGEDLAKLEEAFARRTEFKTAVLGLVRNAFLVEPVNEEVTSTKLDVRWNNTQRQWWQGKDDLRYCSFEDCVTIFNDLFGKLVEAVEDQDKLSTLRRIFKYNMVPYELPVDYLNAPTGPSENFKMHQPGNIDFFWDNDFRAVVDLRDILLNSDINENVDVFRKIINNKVKIKTYLTDRVLTGAHKTDREKRWEAHPKSVHFATRRECLEIEKVLLIELARFEGFPASLRRTLVERGVISGDEGVYRCPVTYAPLSYPDFEATIVNPMHGRSDFQIDHMHALKAGEGEEYRHTARNVSWISAVGNRIKDTMDVEETRQMLIDIVKRYRDEGLINSS